MTHTEIKDKTYHCICSDYTDDYFPDEKESKKEFQEANEYTDEDMKEVDDEEIENWLHECVINYQEDFMDEIKSYEAKHDKKLYIIKGSLGLWNGRRTGYVLKTGFTDVIGICSEDYNKIYSYDGEVTFEAVHHDGTNIFSIRELTNLGERYYNNHPNELQHIFESNRLSKNITMFKEIYGWKK